MGFILLTYDYDQPSTQHGNADGLSCLPLQIVQPDQGYEAEVVCAVEELQFQTLPIQENRHKGCHS